MSNCTIYQNIFKFKEPHKISIKKALQRIKNGSSKLIVENLRKETDAQKQDAIKKSLPCVVFSGVFEARRDDAIVEHSNFMILDFDYVEDYEKLKSELIYKDYVYSAWRSPRGNGLKALIKIADGKKHKEHFSAIEKEFKDVDKSGKNISRACFESYDPEIYINENAKQFDKIIEDVYKTEIKQQFTSEKETYDNIRKWLDNKSEAFASGNRNNYIFKLAGACCRFGIDQYSTLDYLLRDFATSDFNQSEIKLSVKSAYRANQMGVATFDKNVLVESKTQKEISIEVLNEGYEEFSHVIFAEDISNQIAQIYAVGYEKLNGINAPVLDYHFKLKRKEISLISGFGNMGKSTKMLWILLNRAILYNEKFAIYSPESAPAEEWYLELVEMLAGCDCSAMNTNRPDKETFDYYFKFVGEHFYFVYPEKVSPTAETIKETFLELIIKYKIDGVVIDPFNQLYHDRKGITREDFYLEELLSDFTRFAEQNNIFFLIVAHPKGSSIVVEKDGNYREPSMYDIAGGAMWANKMHNILFYHRPESRTKPDSPLYVFTSDKIKKQKIVGKKGSFEGMYILKKRRFLLPYFDPITRTVDKNIQPFDALQNNMEKVGFIKKQDYKEPKLPTPTLSQAFDDDSDFPF